MFGTSPEVTDEVEPKISKAQHVSSQFHMDVTDVVSQQSAGKDLSQEHFSFVKD